jgi:gliding motility-associated protein GldM
MQVIMDPVSYDTATGKVEGGTLLPLENGMAKLKEAKGTGEHNYGGVIRLKEATGEFKLYPFNSKYTVAAPSVAVSPEKMNVFYIGVDNPVAVSAAGISPDKLIVNASGGGITLKPNGAGKYIVQATSETSEAKINVSAKTETGSKTQGSCTFRVKRIPDPVASIGGKRGTADIRRIDAGALNAVAAKVDNFDFEAPFKITFFEFTAIVHGQPQVFTTNGPNLTEEMKKALTKVSTGSRIFITDVKVVGPDKKERNIPGVTLKVRS